MTLPAIFLLAAGLAMDAMAVAAARGLAARRVLVRDAATMAIVFGGFQALMPLIGWTLGRRAGPFVEAWDHWVAFALLAAIGGKMVWESRRPHDTMRSDELFTPRALVILAVATSIDALAAGITLPLVHAPVRLSVITIGVVTSVMTLTGVYAGRYAGPKLGPRLDALGGVVLIGLGVKVLVDHLG